MSSDQPRPLAVAAEFDARARLLAGMELCALVGGVLAVMWVVPFTPAPRTTYRVIIAALVGLLIVARWREAASWAAIGFRLDNFGRVLVGLVPFIATLVLVAVAIGASAGTLRFGTRFWSMLASVPLWGLLQQYLLLAFAHRRFRVIFGDESRSVLATTALFGVVHLPNPVLTLVCTVGGYVWARAYERSPNLLAHAVTHAIGSAFLANSLPNTWLKNMVVGYRYLLN